MSVQHVNIWCPGTLEGRIGSPETGATDGCEMPPESCEADLGPLQEHLEPVTTELQLLALVFIKYQGKGKNEPKDLGALLSP